jgi:hypothetical protein
MKCMKHMVATCANLLVSPHEGSLTRRGEVQREARAVHGLRRKARTARSARHGRHEAGPARGVRRRGARREEGPARGTRRVRPGGIGHSGQIGKRSF